MRVGRFSILLADGWQNYKPVNGLIKAEIRRRFVSQWNSNNQASQFTVKLNDLKEVNCDIEDPKMEVFATEIGGGVIVEVQMSLGPSDGNMRINVSSIYNGRAQDSTGGSTPSL